MSGTCSDGIIEIRNMPHHIGTYAAFFAFIDRDCGSGGEVTQERLIELHGAEGPRRGHQITAARVMRTRTRGSPILTGTCPGPDTLAQSNQLEHKFACRQGGPNVFKRRSSSLSGWRFPALIGLSRTRGQEDKRLSASSGLQASDAPAVVGQSDQGPLGRDVALAAQMEA